MYDEAGHILGEYSSTGALIEETIWMGDLPVATLQPNGSSVAIYYIHSDHLGTPRKITRTSDNGLMWRWDPDTFGVLDPNTNPAGLGTFTYNLRYPGMYNQGIPGPYINYFRNYVSLTGSYLESDPIGLGGGINTYAYVGGNPLSNIDPFGLLDYPTLVHNYPLPSVYPTNPVPGQLTIWDLIGGKVKQNSSNPNFHNSCSVRMSYALNQSGSKIPFIKGVTVSGANGDWYISEYPTFRIT
jgi:RHS repeat-associated protein